MKPKAKYKDGKPCNHAGCLSHRTHPCEGCGRIGGRYFTIGTSNQIAKGKIEEFHEWLAGNYELGHFDEKDFRVLDEYTRWLDKEEK